MEVTLRQDRAHHTDMGGGGLSVYNILSPGGHFTWKQIELDV